MNHVRKGPTNKKKQDRNDKTPGNPRRIDDPSADLPFANASDVKPKGPNKQSFDFHPFSILHNPGHPANMSNIGMQVVVWTQSLMMLLIMPVDCR
jgi:hypothetical protein